VEMNCEQLKTNYIFRNTYVKGIIVFSEIGILYLHQKWDT